jgi:large subunit ribosomal protein L24
MAAKVRKGDQVIVITGKDKGKTGTVVKVMPKENRVVVQGVNLMKRHTRPSQADPQGGIKEKEASIHISNVAQIDPKSDKPTRVGFKKDKDGKLVRVARKSGETING